MSEAGGEEVLGLAAVARTFVQAGVRLEVLRGVDLSLRAGTLAALVGPSGAGKSTLLHIAGLLERASAGEVRIKGAAASRLGERERTRLRCRRIGFVYQFHHLLPDFSALENVAIPQLVAGTAMGPARARAAALLARLGLEERLHHRPGRLSGGEQQRVAIARALANRPSLLLADEPTGNLDRATAGRVFDALLGVAREGGAAALVATHDPELAARTDAAFALRDGRLVPAGFGPAAAAEPAAAADRVASAPAVA